MWYNQTGEKIMKNKEKVYAVSECLLGKNCKYNGGNNYSRKVAEFLGDKKYIPVCPEMTGGLSCPREPSEIVRKDEGVFVISRTGDDVTGEFVRGAQISCEKLKQGGCTHAILKSRSPSCGVGSVYDGTFSGKIVSGNGIAAEMMLGMGIVCMTEEDDFGCFEID